MKKITLLLVMLLLAVGGVKADVEWSIWEGTNADNVYISKDLIASMEVGDKIIVSFSQIDAGQDGELLIDWNTIAYTGSANYSDYFDYTNNKVTIEITTTLKNQVAGTTAYTKYYYSEGWQSESVTVAGDLRVKANGSLSFSKIVLQKQHSYIVKNYDVSVNIGDWSNSTNVHPSGLTSEDYLYFAATTNDGGTYWQAQLGGGTIIGVTGGFWFSASDTYSTWNDNDVELKGRYIDVTGMKQYHPINSFSIGSIGYATFSASQQVTAPASVKAYKATVDGSTVRLTQFTDNVIPAKTGAIIAGDEGAVLEFTASSESTSETSDLIACTTATDVSTLASGYDYYVLYPGTGESETNLELSTLLGSISDWGGKVTVSNSEPYTAEWTSSSTPSAMGKWLGSDWSSYDILRLVFTSNTVTETVHFGLSYNGQSDSENSGADLATGKLTVDIPLNASHKSAMGNFSFNSNATSGSLTFKSAALIDSDGATVAEFRKTTFGTLAANKAYLKIASGSGSARALDIVFDDGNTTAISSVEKPVINDNVYYNLRGQRIANPTKGLYIVNGKKMIIK